jgi:hypothetical protein
MHHHDVRAGVDLGVHPRLQPVVRRKPFGHAFGEDGRERVVPEHMIVLIDDHEIGVLTRLPDAAQNAFGILGVGRIGRSSGKIGRGLVVLVAGLDPKLVDTRAAGARHAAGRNQA